MLLTVVVLRRLDGNQNNLRSAAYEALMEFVKNSPKVTDPHCCYDTVLNSYSEVAQMFMQCCACVGLLRRCA